MNIKKLLMASAALTAAFGTAIPAQANVVDNPHFKVLGVVIVWGNDGGANTNPIVSDFIIDDDAGNADSDLIAGDVYAVVTGSLDAVDGVEAGTGFELNNAFIDGDDGVLDNTDALTAFNATDTIDGAVPTFESSFYVASNTAFSIDAVATPVTEDGFTLADVGFSMDRTIAEASPTGTEIAFGASAQSPGTDFSGAPTTLDGMSSAGAGAQTVFAGTDRTAASAGTIAAQSVRFDATYTLGTGTAYDLSQGSGEVEATVEYTVYVP